MFWFWMKLTTWSRKQVTISFTISQILNAELKDARACVIGISNDLKFTDFLDPRVRSRLGQQDIVFNPYNAEQLQDILRSKQRLESMLMQSVQELSNCVCRTCSTGAWRCKMRS